MTSPPELRDRLQHALGAAYALGRELGGGMSRVFVAEEVALGRRVVVKLLPPELAEGISAERFAREVRVAASLQEPHIVPVLAAGVTDEGLPYYTMPYVEGESLRARLTRGDALRLDEAVSILRDVAMALEHAHARGVVHRDVKPENVLLSGRTAVVTDFGIAKAIETSRTQGGTPLGAPSGAPSDATLTGVGVSLGTPAYLAPEQAAGDAVDRRADLYAWGVMAYELLGGAHPFAGRTTAQQLIAAHLAEAPRPLGALRPGVPPALAALVMRCLEKSPDRRPEGAGALVAALDPARGGLPRRTRRTSRLAVGAAALAALVTLGIAAVALSRGGGASAASVAVLPFDDMSPAQSDAYFSDGMTEELITGLAQVQGLHVAARTSSFAFKGKHAAPRDVARALGVRAVLEGSVRRDGPRIRLTARLVDAASGDVLWGARFDRDERDVFALQDELTQAIVGALRLRLVGGGGEAIRPRPVASIDAYEDYLRGRYFWNTRRNLAELDRAAAFFERALARDSTYARAWSGLADTYSLMPVFAGRRPAEVYPKARAAALRALALDSTLAEAHTSVGIVRLFYDWDFPAAERTFAHAIALDANSATARLFHAWSLVTLGRMDDAVAELRRARALDPLSLLINARVGTVLLFARRDDEARAALQSAIALDSTFVLTRLGLAQVYAEHDRRFADAAALLPPDDALPANIEAGIPGYVDAVSGRRDEARREARMLESRYARGTVGGDGVAVAYTGLGDRGRAFAWIDSAIAGRASTTIFLAVQPEFRVLHGDPRFARAVQRIGLATP